MLLENEENRYMLDELQHNLPEDVVEELVMVYDSCVNDKKLGCFDENVFQKRLVHLFSYDQRQVHTLCHMLADAPTLANGSVSFKDFVKAQIFFYNGAKAAAPHTDKVRCPV